MNCSRPVLIALATFVSVIPAWAQRSTASIAGTVPGNRSRSEQIAEWFNTAAFKENAPGTFGTLGRNTERGPGLATVDFSAFKRFPMPYSERHKLEFRAEAFNLFNRVNLNNPNTTRTSPLFGRITSAAEPRILQFGLRYSF
jgi:hypothetical protein